MLNWSFNCSFSADIEPKNFTLTQILHSVLQKYGFNIVEWVPNCIDSAGGHSDGGGAERQEEGGAEETLARGAEQAEGGDGWAQETREAAAEPGTVKTQEKPEPGTIGMEEKLGPGTVETH